MSFRSIGSMKQKSSSGKVQQHFEVNLLATVLLVLWKIKKYQRDEHYYGINQRKTLTDLY